MSLRYAPNNLSCPIEMLCPTGARIEQYETQLDALQRLITLAARHAATRHALVVENRAGVEIEVYRGVAVDPRPPSRLDYRDFSVRLARADTETIIERWWGMMDDLRPIPQILTALRYESGYLDSDFFLLATVLDRLSDAWTTAVRPMTDGQYEGMKDAASRLSVSSDLFNNRPVLQARIEALVDTLGRDVWNELHIDRDSWISSLKRHRNLVAHSLEQRRPDREFMTGPGLRALRDATDVVATMVVAQHLGVGGEPLRFLAMRLRDLRIRRHAANILTFDNSGLAGPRTELWEK